MKINKQMIENAEQQFTGWCIGINGTGQVEDLIISMGLEKYEWEHLKRKQMVNCLSKDQRKEINEYFKNKGDS